jgi:hypothetical protein
MNNRDHYIKSHYTYKTAFGKCQIINTPDTVYNEYKTPTNLVKPFKEHFSVSVSQNLKKDNVNQTVVSSVSSQTCNSNIKLNNSELDLKWTKNTFTSTSDPNVWGPSFWFSLHNGASKYPENATSIFRDRMKQFILSIPFILPCEKCRSHAKEYIDNRQNELDQICSGRKTLFNFFVDFHNMVNVRSGKPTVSYEDAYKLYSNGSSVSIMKY